MHPEIRDLPSQSYLDLLKISLSPKVTKGGENNLISDILKISFVRAELSVNRYFDLITESLI